MTDTRDDQYQRIWRVVASIPRGATSSYGVVAARAGLPRRARMVGRALAAAPDELALPWHRVVRADGSIGLPRGSKAFREQCRLLAAEGVAVRDGRIPGKPGAENRESLDRVLWG